MNAFTFNTTPLLHFGPGKISTLPSLAKSFGPKISLITGTNSFMSSEYGRKLLEQFEALKLTVSHFHINHEPTPIMVDNAVHHFAQFAPDVVIAIGGGSVLDAGKAISAMLPLQESVRDYLEGVGTNKKHPGTKVPFIAIPTTAGTGSEATKNAVLSEVGEKGFKKSLRHNNFIPNIAVVDATLTVTCPQTVTAASGMDAFTQLLESYLSTTANVVTDALAYEGLHHVSTSLMKAFQEGSNLEARTGMAIASYLSGITLANAGLGLVHGFATSIGGFYPIPHGIICSSLMAAANKITVRTLRQKGDAQGALVKYGRIGKIFSGAEGKSSAFNTDFLLALIENWVAEMNIPSLTSLGVPSSDFTRIAMATGNKNNPALLAKDDIIEVLSLSH